VEKFQFHLCSTKHVALPQTNYTEQAVNIPGSSLLVCIFWFLPQPKLEPKKLK